MNVEQLLGYCKALTDYNGADFDVINDVLVIAGSNELSDWTVNLNTIKLNGYHKGFYDVAVDLPVNKNIKWVTGYSLGGAVAHIYSMLFNVKCVSFSAPKCLAVRPTLKQKSITRFYIENDFISKCPFDFYHPLCKSVAFNGSFANPHSIDNYIDCIRNARLLMKFSEKQGTTQVR